MFQGPDSNTRLRSRPAEASPPPRGQTGARPLQARLFDQVPIDSLAVFRFMFGAIMVVEVYRYFAFGWIGSVYRMPTYHFTYMGFDWVKPWPGYGMYWHFLFLAGCAACMAVGLFYRLATFGLFLSFTYVFLLEQAQYLNHFYLICWASFVMIFVPAHRAFSVDAWRRPEWSRPTAPRWSLWLMRAQVGMAYFFGGIAKLNSDWLSGAPMRDWLAAGSSLPIVGPYITTEWSAYLFSYGGLMIDLFVVPLLLWRRTVWLGLGIVLFFNLMNARLFNIGIFPWFMIAGSLLFLPPDWPRKVLGWLGTTITPAPATEQDMQTDVRTPKQRVVLALLGGYCIFHIFMPLRHWLYPGNVSWTEEGHNFSWHMKLRDKDATECQFFVTDPDTATTWEIDLPKYLHERQIDKMAVRPDMTLKFARDLAEEYRQKGHPNIQVRAWIMVSLNGRQPQLLIDPKVDLAAQPRSLWPKKWIMPLTEPLPPFGKQYVPKQPSIERNE